MEKLVALAKRRGFIYQGSEIYGGLAGTWDYGPYGVELKNNIKNLWWRTFVQDRDDMYGVDAAILMHPKVWEASGHVSGFSDPLVECKKCKRRFRADHVEGKCPACGGEFGEVRQFNMMFKTHIGATEDTESVSYLRPETAGGMFVNFKNVVDSLHPKMPFGLGQIGKAFRNEIAPRDFVFRSREFEQMEVEYFIHPRDWEAKFEEWRTMMHAWLDAVGIDAGKVSELEVPDADRAHYSKRTIDFEFEYPFGKKELYGLAYRTDFDLSAHQTSSGVELAYLDEATGEKFVPHVIEPSLGVDRTVLAVLVSAYHEDEMGEEKRVFLKLPPHIAPIKVAVFPLLKNKPELVAKARDVYATIKKESANWRTAGVAFDDNGNIGKRYRRQDEIGTPYCITVDFDTLENETVTLRDRDTGTQERIAIKELLPLLKEKIQITV
jgi:glycyl-tRNA synthetase